MDQSSEHTTNRAGHILNDNKFEPFDRVLVRDNDYGQWIASFFSHLDGRENYKIMACGRFWKQCIPYTSETAHLLGTSAPYEPPRPPHSYKWGDKVEVLYNGAWVEGVCTAPNGNEDTVKIIMKGDWASEQFITECIRPLEPSHE